MNSIIRVLALVVGTALAVNVAATYATEPSPEPVENHRSLLDNPRIDYDGFLRDAAEVAELRASRRISETTFLEMAADPNTIILDARSREKYDLLHIKGAKNLSLPDMTAAELASLIPDSNTRILIYCNNNFENEPVALPTKAASSSLNIYTFNVLYSYGYRNIYELGPYIDIRQSRLPFAGSLVDHSAPLRMAAPEPMPQS
jgi:hypothetical protein